MALLRLPCCTSFCFRVIVPLAISASAVQRLKCASTPGKAVEAPASLPAFIDPRCQTKCSDPFAEDARSVSVKPESSILPSASKLWPDQLSPSNSPTALALSLSKWPCSE